MTYNRDRNVELTQDQLDAVSGGHHLDHFDIKDFSFGVANPATVGSATGGAGAGKVDFSGFNIKGK